MLETELPALACQLQANGCRLTVATMLREPAKLQASAVFFNNVPAANVRGFVEGESDSVVPCDAARAAPPLWRGQQLRTAAANVASGRALRNAWNV